MTTLWTRSNSSPAGAYRGQWVALDNCRYDRKTAKPAEGDVVDSDVELSQLYARLRKSGKCSCAILFCDEKIQLESTGVSRLKKWLS